MAWDDILEQDLAKRILQTHLATGRVANAYLLTGPEGVGKRRMAWEMAKALNCTAERERPCDACPVCAQILRGTHPDVHAMSPSGASDQIRIDDIRHLISRIALRPFSARVQVAIIDGVQRLTEEAANSLLKALEEPPAHTRFLLLTSRLAHCLPTVVSRCQLIRCRPLSVGSIRQILLDAQACDPSTADAVAPLAGGSASSAMDLAKRWAAYHAILSRLASQESSAWMDQPLPETRQELVHFLDGMMGWLRDLAVAAAAMPERIVHAAYKDALRRQANRIDVDRCLETAFELVSLRESMEQFVSPRLVAALAREKWLSLQPLTTNH